jgi:hypothetical protein
LNRGNPNALTFSTRVYTDVYADFTGRWQFQGVLQVRSFTKAIVYGPDDSWGNRFACGPRAITTLLVAALILHTLDLLTGIHMMQTLGMDQEQNPVVRLLFQIGGPITLASFKLGVVTTGVLVLAHLARLGRTRLARNALLIIAILGLVGFSSNLV